MKILTLKKMREQLEKGNVFEIRPHVFQSFSTGKIVFITRGGEKEYLKLKRRRKRKR